MYANTTIVVVGDPNTRKSSLISGFPSSLVFQDDVPSVLPHTFIPNGLLRRIGPLTIIDTPSTRHEDTTKELLKVADVVIVTYACDKPETLDRIAIYWIPQLRLLKINVPVVMVVCKLDKVESDKPVMLKQHFMRKSSEIHACILCLAITTYHVPEVFFYTQKEVDNPVAALFDRKNKVFKPRVRRALKMIFKLCDRDEDSALFDAELFDAEIRLLNDFLILVVLSYDIHMRQ